MTFKGKIVKWLPNMGIDNSQGEQNIGDDYCADAQNVRFWKGDIIQRGGFAKYNAAGLNANAVTGIHQMVFNDLSTKLVVASGSDIGYDNAGTFTSIKGALAFTSGQDNLFRFCELNNLVIGTNGVDQLFKWSGAGNAAVLGGTPPSKARTCITFRNRIMVGNVTNDAGRSTIQWSAINNQDDWTSTSAGNASPLLQAGQEIRGLAQCGNEAFLFYDRSIFRIYPTGDSFSPFAFPNHDNGVGCVAPASLVTVPNKGLIFFASARGIYKMEAPSYRPERISKPIDGTWASVNVTRLKSISGELFDRFNEVWFSVSAGSSATNNQILAYDYERKTWTIYKGINANALGRYLDANSVFQLSHGDYAGLVHIDESGTNDNAAAIDAYLTSKSYALVDGWRRGSVRFLQPMISSQGANSRLQVNYGYSLVGIQQFGQVSQDPLGDTYDNANYDTGTFTNENQLEPFLDVTGSGTHFQFQLRQATLNDTFRCFGVHAGIKSEGPVQ